MHYNSKYLTIVQNCVLKYFPLFNVFYLTYTTTSKKHAEVKYENALHNNYNFVDLLLPNEYPTWKKENFANFVMMSNFEQTGSSSFPLHHVCHQNVAMYMTISSSQKVSFQKVIAFTVGLTYKTNFQKNVTYSLNIYLRLYLKCLWSVDKNCQFCF